jgi:hypothetical protein
VEGAGEGVSLNYALNAGAVDPASKGEDVASFGSDYEVLLIDGAFYSAGLIRAFEVAGDHGSFLLKLEVFGGG